ncbi:MAG: hypothetical protein CMF80_06655 [Candidatus Marinimicrobia bacterium]|nr:hypothetical protein [Candidatus Neomarinimicrobiota bacterium]|tara:strand:+ start:75 stop:1016 length:942 start_codon:yes stop_codon:yes gene_type:complete
MKNHKTIKLIKKKPTIGILTAPVPDKKQCFDAKSYLYKSYVQWAKQKKCRIIPIQYNLPKHLIKILLSQINGIIMVGGSINNLKTHTLKTYRQYLGACKFIVDYAKKENNRKNYYPIFSICLGFEIMGLISQKKIGKTDEFAEGNIDTIKNIGMNPLHLTNTKGKLTNIFTEEERDYISKNPSVYYYHKLSFDIKRNYTRKICDVNHITSTAYKKGKEYITSMEHKKYPFYSTLFHPEKPKFLSYIKNTKASDLVSMKLIDFFIRECKKNKNKWIGGKYDRDFLIENYTVYTLKKNNRRVPSYIFGEIDKHYN